MNIKRRRLLRCKAVQKSGGQVGTSQASQSLKINTRKPYNRDYWNLHRKKNTEYNNLISKY